MTSISYFRKSTLRPPRSTPLGDCRVVVGWLGCLDIRSWVVVGWHRVASGDAARVGHPALSRPAGCF
ncbi:hypothetical protein [Halomicronema sp. CCY15110]|uniref:hypothetical protein n=1 Tax=Halomicronema sp. CCY15110 TaxID=2767773 RepID=UPI001950ADB1|nr:hypothetical protein [Halomicronema sp. CCY15110]